jgi:hypothetical protein
LPDLDDVNRPVCGTALDPADLANEKLVVEIAKAARSKSFKKAISFQYPDGSHAVLPTTGITGKISSAKCTAQSLGSGPSNLPVCFLPFCFLQMSSDVAATYAPDLMTLLTGMAAMDQRLTDMEEHSELLEDY